MNTLKNIDIAREYNISSSTVTRWIQLNFEGKNNLQLHKKSNRYLIIDSPHNKAEISRLVEDGKKYRSNIDCKRVNLGEDFLKYFSHNQAIEIFNNIELQKKINNKFTYVHSGAKVWDDYYIENALNGRYPTPNRVINLLDSSLDYLKYKLSGYTSVNLIDIGPGNSYPVKNFISSLSKITKINKYAAIDISSEMTKLSEENIKNWFPDIKFEKYVADVENTYFDKIFFDIQESFDGKILNLILYLGSIIGLHDDKVRVLNNIREGLSKNSLLVISNTLDSQLNRSDFSYVKNPLGDKQNLWIPELLGINIDKCELISKFNSINNSRVLNLKLDQDYEITLDILGKKRKLELHSGEEINLWQHEMTNISSLIEDFKDANLQLVGLMTELDLSHVLIYAEPVIGYNDIV